MQQTVSELIGKPLFTQSGAYRGCVQSVQADPHFTRIRNFVCFDKDDEDFLLPASGVAAFGQDALIVRDNLRTPCKTCAPLPFKFRAFSETGEELGYIDDFLRDGLTLTHAVLSGGGTFPAERLIKVTDAALFDLSENFIAAASSPRKRGEESAKARETAAAADSGARKPTADELAERGEESAKIRETADGQNPNTPPLRAGKGLLTGKILPRPLLDARGNVLAPAGARVTAEVIRRAMAHNKLFALTLLCASQTLLRAEGENARAL